VDPLTNADAISSYLGAASRHLALAEGIGKAIGRSVEVELPGWIKSFRCRGRQRVVVITCRNRGRPGWSILGEDRRLVAGLSSRILYVRRLVLQLSIVHETFSRSSRTLQVNCPLVIY
jgi:hypothetical protein